MNDVRMTRCIERKAAQEIICGWCGICETPTLEDLEKCDDICPQFAEIPDADVRPLVRGSNVSKAYPSLFECSVCGWCDGDTTTGDTRTYNFCPNCGADMRGGGGDE